MCSIFGMFDLQPGDDLAALRQQALELSQRQRHRGPDWSGVFVDAGVILVHERLAIVDPASGAQPLRSRDGALALAVNGEIYNHRELRAASGYDFTTGSDCEVINALVSRTRSVRLNGWPSSTASSPLRCGTAMQRAIVIARDPIGVCPLYWGHDGEGRLCVASEMKALVGPVRRCGAVPAGPCVRQRGWRTAPLLPQALARLRRIPRATTSRCTICARPSSRPCIAS